MNPAAVPLLARGATSSEERVVGVNETACCWCLTPLVIAVSPAVPAAEKELVASGASPAVFSCHETWYFSALLSAAIDDPPEGSVSGGSATDPEEIELSEAVSCLAAESAAGTLPPTLAGVVLCEEQTNRPCAPAHAISLATESEGSGRHHSVKPDKRTSERPRRLRCSPRA